MSSSFISKKEAATYKSPQLEDTAAYRTLPISILNNKLLTFADVQGKKLTFAIDTGAESNVLDSRLPDRIFENVNITRRVKLTGAGSKSVEALYGEMKNMTLGGQPVASLPVLVTNLEKLCYAYDKCIDGMLGFDFLSLHKVGFNFVKNKMYIWK